MVKKEIAAALEIAKSDRTLSHVDHSVLDGLYTRSFSSKPVDTTLEVVARVMRELVCLFNGQIDNNELDNLSYALRRKVRIVGR